MCGLCTNILQLGLVYTEIFVDGILPEKIIKGETNLRGRRRHGREAFEVGISQ